MNSKSEETKRQLRNKLLGISEYVKNPSLEEVDEFEGPLDLTVKKESESSGRQLTDIWEHQASEIDDDIKEPYNYEINTTYYPQSQSASYEYETFFPVPLQTETGHMKCSIYEDHKIKCPRCSVTPIYETDEIQNPISNYGNRSSTETEQMKPHSNLFLVDSSSNTTNQPLEPYAEVEIQAGSQFYAENDMTIIPQTFAAAANRQESNSDSGDSISQYRDVQDLLRRFPTSSRDNINETDMASASQEAPAHALFEYWNLLGRSFIPTEEQSTLNPDPNPQEQNGGFTNDKEDNEAENMNSNCEWFSDHKLTCSICTPDMDQAGEPARTSFISGVPKDDPKPKSGKEVRKSVIVSMPGAPTTDEPRPDPKPDPKPDPTRKRGKGRKSVISCVSTAQKGATMDGTKPVPKRKSGKSVISVNPTDDAKPGPSSRVHSNIISDAVADDAKPGPSRKSRSNLPEAPMDDAKPGPSRQSDAPTDDAKPGPSRKCGISDGPSDDAKPGPSHTGAWLLQCSPCQMVFGEEAETYVRHMQTQHEGERNECPYCAACFVENPGTIVQGHPKRLMDEDVRKDHICGTCNAAYPEKWLLEYHILSHQKEFYCCSKCNKTFPR